MTYQEAYQEILRAEEEIRVLENRKQQEEQEREKKKQQAAEYTDQFYKERADVEKLEKMSLTHLFALLGGSYDEKHQKEYQEYISAKNRMDDWNCQLEEQKKLIQRYQNDIGRLKAVRKERMQRLQDDYPEGRALAAEEEEKRRGLLRKQKELQEAQDAASQVFSYARQAVARFSSADSWAAWDMVGGGFFSGMAKYSELDEGTAAVHQMQAAAARLAKELKDVDMAFDGKIDAVDDGIRTWDLIVDNIFTDWNVRDRIKENLNQMNRYCDRLEHLMTDLREKRMAVERELRQLNGEV